MSIYMGQPSGTRNQYAEFFGTSDGKWSESTAGYAKTDKIYSTTTNDVGWKTLSTSISMADSLRFWYEPYKDKHVS